MVGGELGMEAEKRKRLDDGETKTKTRKKEGVNVEEKVTDEEVEEFYAILRKIQEVKMYFKMGNGRKHKSTETRWLPCFQAEDFEERAVVNDCDGNNGERKTQEADEQNSGLDLNTDPGSE